MELRRRPMLMQPGESLLVRSDPMGAAVRWAEFMEESGLSSDHLEVNPLCSFPIPLYPAQWPEGHKRWEGTRAEAMWHPLMWLPNRLAHRYSIGLEPTAENDPLGLHAETHPMEDDHTWIVRVCLELTASGMYDPMTGLWADVLSTVGIDIDDEFDLGRVQEWLDGGEDEVLDALDLSPHFANPQDPMWALESAMEQTPDLFVVTWATVADTLAGTVMDLLDRYDDDDDEEVEDEGDALEPGELRWMASMVVDYGWASLRRVPDSGGQEAADAWWDLVRSQVADESNSDAEIASVILPMVLERLEEIRDYYWPVMVEIGNSAGLRQDATQPV